MSTPGRLQVAADGRVTGPASITYNSPFPVSNGSWGSGAIRGVVEHTMVGNLPGTIAWFNNAASEVSAHFGIDQDGGIHQFGPIGKGWVAWAEMAGNLAWYSIEHADDGNPENPLTDPQITASAQLLEVLSRFAGFPLQVTDSIDGRGYGTHVMGGEAWGGHTCPGPGPRAGQRFAITELARAIRAGTAVSTYTTSGRESLVEVGLEYKAAPSAILRATAVHDGLFAPALASYIDAANLKAPMAAGIVVQIPAA
jgi:hypothetical protein